MIKARVTVTLKNGVLDPQGKAIEGALTALDFNGVSQVRQGKVFDLALEMTNKAEAEEQIKAMCEKLL
ncbi:phosphoribosylformylglycinamidine synthase subunit PurS, partial [Rhizobium sp.]|uniref:phosphoribosylformylglycinamidine synthase subunit PurS n=1 Tax=Rhizobium sp. TaxID=391 RepID=UPI000E896C58|nr:phosphoribosylformylglycinamidine synthase [Rhizobium sp.]